MWLTFESSINSVSKHGNEVSRRTTPRRIYRTVDLYLLDYFQVLRHRVRVLAPSPVRQFQRNAINLTLAGAGSGDWNL